MRFLVKSAGADVRKLIIFAAVAVRASLRRLLRMTVPTLAVVLTIVSPIRAQNTPHLGYVYPAGGRQGTTFQVLVGGQFLVNVTNAFVSGAGVHAKVMEYNRPLNQKEFSDLRDRLKVLQDKRQAARREPNSTNTWTTADDREFAEIRDKIIKNPPNRQGNPAIRSEGNTS